MSKIELKIKTYGESVLRNGVAQVSQADDYHRDILKEMSRLMYEISGIGLAAPQVGIAEAMIVIDAGTGLYKLLNPRIIKKEGRQTIEEGCLSLPGVSVKVKRAKRVKVEAQDENGKPVEIEAEDLLAAVFQHEIDHLDGKLIIDYASFFDRRKIVKNL